jgi:hypothetical protein
MVISLKLLIFLSAMAAGWLVWYVIGRKKRSASHKASPHLANELLILVNGDTATARRLLRDVNHLNPGRSVNWCLEKAIYDLERDLH